MKKYASRFNEMLILAADKTKKKGGSMAAVFKLIQELADFEGSIQEAIDAQEMTENKTKIEALLGELDKMYEVLFEIAKGGIIDMRNQRVAPVTEEIEEEVAEEPIEEKEEKTEMSSSFTSDDLKKQLETKPRSPVVLDVPRVPRI